MKSACKLWITIIPMLIFLVYPHRTTAQNVEACFMVTSSGKTINLGTLCGITPTNSGVFRIPIKRRIAKTPVIDVTFNGNKTFEMILDTGATSVVITQAMVEALKITPTGTMQASIADGSEVQFNTSNIQAIAVGGAVVNNVQVAIAPKADIGLLGHDFFDNYDVKILQKEVEFHRR